MNEIELITELHNACEFVSDFLDRLETHEDDPLTAIRRRVHKPLRDALNPAINHATQYFIELEAQQAAGRDNATPGAQDCR